MLLRRIIEEVLEEAAKQCIPFPSNPNEAALVAFFILKSAQVGMDIILGLEQST